MKKLLEHTRRPDISFHINGTIRINARVARLLSLRPGDAINIAVNNGEHLLFAIRHPNANCRYEAQCYRSKRGASENYCANSVRLCRALFQLTGLDNAQSVSFMTGDIVEYDGVRYLPVITRFPINNYGYEQRT